MISVEKLESIDVLVPDSAGDIAVLAGGLADYLGNIIIDFRNEFELNEADLDALDSIADDRAEMEKSFALCNVTGINKSYIEKRFDDEIIAVPTLNEAVDFIYMEEQERELGL